MRLFTTLSALAALAVLQAPALAAEPAGPQAPSLQRFSVLGQIGANLVLPFAGVQLGYRLPVLGDRLEATAAYNPINASFTLQTLHTAEVGARYYFGDLAGAWRPFASASAGAFMSMAQPDPTNPANAPYPFSATPAAYVGGGIDWLPIPNAGLSATLTAGYPMALRPALALKLAI